MTINKRIRELRMIHQLTQGKFAARIAVSLGHLAEMESGLKVVNARMIKLIAREFDVDEQWLRTGEGDMYNDRTDLAVATVTSVFRSLSSHYRDCAIAQVNALADLQATETQ